MSPATKCLLDTDILSLYLRKQQRVVVEGQTYLRSHKVFSFSIITRFEILRGMKVKNANSQLIFFERFCSNNEILDIDDNIIVRAADIYADLYRSGRIIGDADILIAATALEYGHSVVTNNESHFERIHGLNVVNWNK
jgi:tRNA(fMet)-specific endonuclease VapC